MDFGFAKYRVVSCAGATSFNTHVVSIYIIMEVLCEIKNRATNGAVRHFADFDRFAGPIVSPIKCSK